MEYGQSPRVHRRMRDKRCPDAATAHRAAVQFAHDVAYSNRGNSFFTLRQRVAHYRNVPGEGGNEGGKSVPVDDTIPGLTIRWFARGGPMEVDVVCDRGRSHHNLTRSQTISKYTS